MPTTEEERLLAEISRLSEELKAAQEALTTERFKDVPRLERGTLVLVPRKLFGQTRLWPAKIGGVHLDYSSGRDANGVPWERHIVSYHVYLQQKDGSYGGSSAGYYAREVQPAPHLEDA